MYRATLKCDIKVQDKDSYLSYRDYYFNIKLSAFSTFWNWHSLIQVRYSKSFAVDIYTYIYIHIFIHYDYGVDNTIRFMPLWQRYIWRKWSSTDAAIRMPQSVKLSTRHWSPHAHTQRSSRINIHSGSCRHMASQSHSELIHCIGITLALRLFVHRCKQVNNKDTRELGFLPDGTQPLSETMLHYHQGGPVTFIGWKFHKMAVSQPWITKISFKPSWGQWVRP